MKTVSLALAAGLVAFSVGVASAQTAKPALSSLAQPGVTKGSGKVAGGATAALSAGWNLGHCYSAVWFSPDAGDNYTYAFNIEGSYIYVDNDIYTAATIQSVCLQGEDYGWYVTNTSTGAYEEIWSKW